MDIKLPLTDSEQATLRAVAFFATFHYPVTVQEIVKYAHGYPLTVTHTWAALQRFLAEGLVLNEGPLWTLEGEGRAFLERKNRYPFAILKHRSVVRWVNFLRLMPGVKGIAVGNSLAYHFTGERGDADLFIVTHPGQTWLTRLLTTLPFLLFRRRPGHQAQHPIDLSFFMDEHHYDLSALQLEHDPYLAHWLMSLSPVLGGEWWSTMWAKNQALYKNWPHAQAAERAYAFRCRAQPLPRIALFNSLDKPAEILERAQFPGGIRLLMNQDSRVRVEPGLLKFHTNDRRAEYADRYSKLCSKYGLAPYPSC